MKLYKVVNDKFVEADEQDVKEAYHECGYISLDFSIQDLEMKNEDNQLGLSLPELQEAAEIIERTDCSIGINWETIDCGLQIVVDRKNGI